MANVDRRSVLLSVVVPTVVLPTMAIAQAPAAGKELAPGVRQIDFGERDSLIAAYKKVRLRDIVIAPKASAPKGPRTREPRSR